MDHLDIPEEYKHKVPKIIRLGITPKYDGQGFDGFLDRIGTTAEELLRPRTDEDEKRIVESTLIEWLFFGLLHEFELAIGVPIDPESLTLPYEDPVIGSCRILSTRFLNSYVREAAIERLWVEGVPLHIQEGDVVTCRKVHPVDFSRASYIPGIEEKYKYLFELSSMSDVRLKVTKIEHPYTCTLTNLATGEKLPKTVIGTMLILVDMRPRPEHTPPLVSSWSMDCLRGILENILNLKYGLRLERTLGMETRLSAALATSKRILESIVWNSKSTVQSSIIYCLASLREAIWNVMAMCGADFRDASVNCWLMASQSMRLNGWCAARVAQWTQARDAMSFVTELLVTHDQKDHRHCNILQCANRPRKQDYAQHDSECASSLMPCPETWPCSHFEVAESDILEIWQNGGIPGIQRLPKMGTPAQEFQLVDVKGRPFVAISHVWAHGLGNPEANSLPTCQLDRVFTYIDQLGCTLDTHLWLDSLVVPVTNGQTKLQAMMRLAEIYSEAEKVLVLDRGLLKVGNHWLEQRLQLGYSEWLTRLWTLQEGRSAKALYIQFKDRPVPLSELIKSTPSSDQEVNEAITKMMNSSGIPLQTVFALPEHGFYSFTQKFMYLASEISRRNVTDPADEPICLANLLGLKIELYPLTMRDVYEAAPEIPQDIIFTNSPRLPQKGFRWAPSTFIRRDGIGSLDPRAAILRPDGLEITKDVIILPERFDLVVCKNHFRQSFYSIDCGKHGIFSFRLSYLPLLDDEIPMCIYRPAVILKGFNRNYESSNGCVLVANYERRGEVHSCRFGILVWTWMGAEARARYAHGRGSQYSGPEVSLKGEYLQNQKICID